MESSIASRLKVNNEAVGIWKEKTMKMGNQQKTSYKTSTHSPVLDGKITRADWGKDCHIRLTTLGSVPTTIKDLNR